MSKIKNDIESALELLSQRRSTPVSTYRLQLHHGFGFRDAQALVAYLSELGVTDCYTSPILKARPGSMHGYDICDHNALNPELGTEEDYERFVQELKDYRMGHILDFVPNHMGIDPETNPWWHDVLENGPSSPYARFFDILWNPIKPELKGKVLLPILGGPYGVVLERGEIRLDLEDGVFSIRYYEHHLPIDPKQYARILRHNLDTLEAELKDEPTLREYLSIMTEFDNLPANTETAPERMVERQREKAVAQDRLTRLVRSSPEIREHLRRTVDAFNGQPGQPDSFNALHALLEAQAYRLAYWKTAFHEINYRRFFDINALAGLRVENADVFPATHHLMMRYIAENKITGLRIDHPDGLYDPAVYFEKLQDMFLQEWVKHALQQVHPDDFPNGEWPAEYQEAIRTWRVAERKRDPKGLAARPLYVVAEKILSPGETLDAHWAIDGTSGYDFLNDVNGLFIDPRHAARMQDIYIRFSGKRIPFDLVTYVCKKLIMSTSLASELNVLAYSLHEIAERDRRSRDFTLDSLRDALKEVIACFPVYRTYMNASRAGATDRQIVEQAIAKAIGRNRALEPSIFEFVHWVLTPDNAGQVSNEVFHRQLGFTMKFQQYTGPVHAKGLEDTAFYRHNVLLALNEVGSALTRFGTSPAQFHEANRQRQAEWRYAMLATATHDTKRGEDTRVRLDVLSEIPDEWEVEVNSWSELNQGRRSRLGKDWAPDWNDEYHYYQALLGAWNWEQTEESRRALADRMQEYMLKAVKEAKLHTSWVSPNEAYEKGVVSFVEKTLLGEESGTFMKAFTPFAQRVARVGMINSLAQLVLKIASPGVPDFYQGSELWNLSLVDPDNRREVDYSLRRRMLTQLEPLIEMSLEFVGARRTSRVKRILVRAGGHAVSEEHRQASPVESPRAESLLDHWEDGAIKMFVTASGLRLRRHWASLFMEGTYIPLDVRGEHAEHVVAFARADAQHGVVAVVPRCVASLVSPAGGWPVGRGVWQGTSVSLPPEMAVSTLRNIFTRSEIDTSQLQEPHVLPLADLLDTFPVGLFVAEL